MHECITAPVHSYVAVVAAAVSAQVNKWSILAASAKTSLLTFPMVSRLLLASLPAVLAFFPVPPEQTNEQLSDSATKDLAKCCSKGVLRNERCEATTLVKRFHSRAQKLPGSETHEAMWERYESKAKVHQVRNMTSRSCV